MGRVSSLLLNHSMASSPPSGKQPVKLDFSSPLPKKAKTGTHNWLVAFTKVDDKSVYLGWGRLFVYMAGLSLDKRDELMKDLKVANAPSMRITMIKNMNDGGPLLHVNIL